MLIFFINGSATIPAIEAIKKKKPAPITIAVIGIIAISANILYPFN